jgi:hypothetical protein
LVAAGERNTSDPTKDVRKSTEYFSRDMKKLVFWSKQKVQALLSAAAAAAAAAGSHTYRDSWVRLVLLISRLVDDFNRQGTADERATHEAECDLQPDTPCHIIQ